MNKRIRELAEQAWQWANNQVDIPKPQIIRFEEKFAELMVKECIVQIGEAIPDTNCSASGAYKTARIAATSRVKQHFGVEE